MKDSRDKLPGVIHLIIANEVNEKVKVKMAPLKIDGQSMGIQKHRIL
tara:strand:- start:7 stop:147 length:141 start_codon:yes stop_codon:yes gene_type:complete